MNIEAYQKKNIICTCLSHDGSIRLLEKKSDINTFEEILNLENEIEDINNKIEDSYYEINKLKEQITTKIYMHVLEFVLLLLSWLIFKNIPFYLIISFIGVLETFGLIIDGFIPNSLTNIKKYNHSILKLHEKKERLSSLLENIKIKSKLKVETNIKSEISNDDANMINRVTCENKNVANLYKIYSLRILKDELIRHSNNNDCIEEVDINYPGIDRKLIK